MSGKVATFSSTRDTQIDFKDIVRSIFVICDIWAHVTAFRVLRLMTFVVGALEGRGRKTGDLTKD